MADDMYSSIQKDYGTSSGSIPSVGLQSLPSLGGLADKVKSSIGSIVDPSKARLGLAGLIFGASSARVSTAEPKWLNNGKTCMAGSNGDDWRIRISLSTGANILYREADNELLTPLRENNGVVFPILPQVQVTHTAKYSSTSVTHSNYAMQFYEGSEVGSIQINGEFPAQNIKEGQYLLAAIQFFRSATKMFWGGDSLAGTPPPLLFLDGFGGYYFPHVPCVLTSFLHTMPEDKDFIEVPPVGGKGPATRLPTQSTVQIVLQPIYSRAAVNQFSLSDFAKGNMLGGANGKTPGGFI
jgi:hypothetical protein